jgi:hypothetical protein
MSGIETKYIGVVSLLGRLSEGIEDFDVKYMIDNAVEDFINSEVGQRFVIIPNSRGGFSLEPRKNTKGEQKI